LAFFAVGIARAITMGLALLTMRVVAICWFLLSPTPVTAKAREKEIIAMVVAVTIPGNKDDAPHKGRINGLRADDQYGKCSLSLMAPMMNHDHCKLSL